MIARVDPMVIEFCSSIVTITTGEDILDPTKKVFERSPLLWVKVKGHLLFQQFFQMVRKQREFPRCKIFITSFWKNSTGNWFQLAHFFSLFKVSKRVFDVDHSHGNGFLYLYNSQAYKYARPRQLLVRILADNQLYLSWVIRKLFGTNGFAATTLKALTLAPYCRVVLSYCCGTAYFLAGPSRSCAPEETQVQGYSCHRCRRRR